METSGKTARGITVRAFISSNTVSRADADDLAERLENELRVPGSTITEIRGRWYDNTEPGFVVEVTKTGHDGDINWAPEGALRMVRSTIEEFNQESLFTVYVTATVSQVMEVF